jgi:hypothetical protein
MSATDAQPVFTTQTRILELGLMLAAIPLPLTMTWLMR